MNAYNEVIREIEQLNFKGNLTRSDVYRLDKLEAIKQELSEAIETSLKESLIKICQTTSNELTFTTINEDMVNEIINKDMNGSNYSQRIWSNTDKLVNRIKNNLTREITTGINPDRLKKELMNEFNSAFYQSNRLVRTESERVFNSSAMKSYENVGIKKIKILVGHDDRACDECKALADKLYNINEVPLLPIHPNCRCCYCPVITKG